MEISSATRFTFYTTRLFGLAPYSVRPYAQKGQAMRLDRSIWWTVYSVVLIVLLVGFTLRGIVYDASSAKPIRMKTPTSKAVTSLDMMVVVTSCVMGVICGCVSLQQTQELNDRLREADDTLALYTDERKDKKRGLVIFVCVLMIITSTVGLDIFVWQNITQKMQENFNVNTSSNLIGFSPFYCLYYVLMTLQASFAQSALALGRRFQRLNVALLKNATDSTTPVVKIYQVPSMQEASKKKNVDQNKGLANLIRASVPAGQCTKHVLERLLHIHAQLGKATENISKAFGIALVSILGSCLLHLVATTYFLLIEVLGNKDMVFTFLQFLWLFVHLFRLILIVEPCHITYVEARKTTTIVCDLMRTTTDPVTRSYLKQFWKQLIIQNIQFSACGLCTIDRQILSSFFGALCTYLVILMQFKKTDDQEGFKNSN